MRTRAVTICTAKFKAASKTSMPACVPPNLPAVLAPDATLVGLREAYSLMGAWLSLVGVVRIALGCEPSDDVIDEGIDSVTTIRV